MYITDNENNKKTKWLKKVTKIQTNVNSESACIR